MNLSRRSFLKLSLAPVAAIAAPAASAALLRVEKFTFNLGETAKGNYSFTFYFKRVGSDRWQRFSTSVFCEEDMLVKVKTDLEEGDLVAGMQLEIDDKTTNYTEYSDVGTVEMPYPTKIVEGREIYVPNSSMQLREFYRTITNRTSFKERVKLT